MNVPFGSQEIYVLSNFTDLCNVSQIGVPAVAVENTLRNPTFPTNSDNKDFVIGRLENLDQDHVEKLIIFILLFLFFRFRSYAKVI